MNEIDVLKKILEDAVINKKANKDEINKIFEEHKITDPSKKINIMKEILNVDSQYTPNYDDLTIEEQLAFELAIFANGKTLRLKKAYAKLHS